MSDDIVDSTDIDLAGVGWKGTAENLQRELTRLRAAESVLRYREAELLELKGPCRTPDCRLHYAHSGPCDIRVAPSAGGSEPTGGTA